MSNRKYYMPEPDRLIVLKRSRDVLVLGGGAWADVERFYPSDLYDVDKGSPFIQDWLSYHLGSDDPVELISQEERRCILDVIFHAHMDRGMEPSERSKYYSRAGQAALVHGEWSYKNLSDDAFIEAVERLHEMDCDAFVGLIEGRYAKEVYKPTMALQKEALKEQRREVIANALAPVHGMTPEDICLANGLLDEGLELFSQLLASPDIQMQLQSDNALSDLAGVKLSKVPTDRLADVLAVISTECDLSQELAVRS